MERTNNPVISVDITERLRSAAIPLDRPRDYDPLMWWIGDASYVLIGEASHGSHEFYRERAEITRRLIREKGFSAVAVEADWPDTYQVNCYVRGASSDTTPEEALSGFQRFPTWMWRNTVVVEFMRWLREHNASLPAGAEKVGFYGLDLYSLNASVAAVLRYLDRVDPEAAQRARNRYSCFDHYGEDTQAYGYEAGFGLSQSCEDAVVLQMMELQGHAHTYRSRDGRVAEDDYFYAQQNARLVKDAEEYYRSMFRGRVSSWNLRDCHMVDTLDELTNYLGRRGSKPKIVVWAHNSHLGDARATDMGRSGELNVGQLVRDRHPREAFLVGLTTHTGTVTAASRWDGVAERKWVRPGLKGSCEALFHDVGIPRFLLNLRDSKVSAALQEPRLERAIGVIYQPATERQSHYFQVTLPEQFDAMIHLDLTTALEPLEISGEWAAGEAPGTYPTGL